MYLDSLIKEPHSRSGLQSQADTQVSKAHVIANKNMMMM